MRAALRDYGGRPAARVPPPSGRPAGRALLLALLCALAGALPAAAGTFRGRVFLDTNGNQVWDAGDRPVGGCLVSDERSLARTSADGRFQLELPPGPAVVFVVNPPDTWPAGAWWVHLEEGAAGGAHAFPLRAQEQPEPLYFVQGTDIHLRPDVVASYRRYLAHIEALPLPVRFVVHTGDLVADATMLPPLLARPLFALYERESQALRLPLRHVMGNHEVVGCGLPAAFARGQDWGKALYRRRLGPASYAFRYGRAHFIALDGTTLRDGKPYYTLDPDSAAWAARYLAEVPADEPVVLLVHEPLGATAADQRLLEALRGKRLAGVLCGHGHARTLSTWGGAPQVMGGAVSYPWHGLLPFPPQPRGYVLYRLGAGRLEHLFLDWATERSFDITRPLFTEVLTGRQAVRGLVSDLQGTITTVACAVAGRAVPATVRRHGTLAQAFSAEVDLSPLADGVYDLVVTARAGAGQEWRHSQPLLVVNGRQSRFTAAGPATLQFRVAGVTGAGNTVLLNGETLAAIPAGTRPTEEVTVPVPADRLRRLNTILFRAAPREGGYDPLSVQAVWLHLGDRRYRDVRFAPLQRRAARPPRDGGAPEVAAYIDLTYHDARAPQP